MGRGCQSLPDGVRYTLLREWLSPGPRIAADSDTVAHQGHTRAAGRANLCAQSRRKTHTWEVEGGGYTEGEAVLKDR